MNIKSEPVEKKSFICQVETYLGTKEYARHGRCVRLIGIDIQEYPALMDSQSEGVTTFILELDFWEFFMQEFGVRRWWKVAQLHGEIDRLESELNSDRQWYHVELEVVTQSADYFYRTFSEDAPTYVGAKRFQKVDITNFGGAGIATAGALTMCSKSAPSHANLSQVGIDYLTVPRLGGEYVFDAFHVGQGMCSLVHNEHVGLLLDAGAGKPVTRALYLDKVQPLQNNLRALVMPLKCVRMVASHTDYDHWKLLAWDPLLLDKIEKILVPDRTNHLLFKDQAIIDKCLGIQSATIILDNNTSLTLHRAAPSYLDSNGDCLVAVFEREGQQVLAPGDYVYSRFKSDGTPAIQGLLVSSYEAVIVPHHGDKASADDVVTPASTHAKAFFSAGTHQGYKHPTDESRLAHNAAKFVEISHCNKAFILKIRLL